MNEETLKIAKKIEKLKREFSMLPKLSERYSNLEIEEYQHYLLELEELLIVFKYLTQQKPINTASLAQIEAPKEIVEEHETPEKEIAKVEAEVRAISENETNENDDLEDVAVQSSDELEKQESDKETIEDKQKIINDAIEDANVDSIAEKEETSESENSEEKSSLEMIETGSSLNDQIKHADNSVATKFAKQPIGDLRNAFGLNERFLFANELFGGDGQEFIRALNELNHLDNFEDAKKMLGARYEKQFAWKNDDETVIAFVEVVERRYL
ncbi:MAG: hypothetical protein ACKVJP_03790 [Flavobacteriales bacterium]|tara:strand:- start:447 stop:1256 length:810 start_codon:yes stop_codon:yes gene_type:complete